ncbi:MAG TPA: cell envelope integrity protein TolA [Gammaproteobacteria bacterium]|nr:cell envelope integrity protein TolA [Gammaproteobacteria bacterium]
MNTRKEKVSPAFLFSLFLHAIVIMALIVSFDFASRTPVLQNADKNSEVINARVLASNPSPKKMLAKPLPKLAQRVMPKPAPAVQNPEPPKKQVIAISTQKIKKVEKNTIAEDMLQDIKQQKLKEKKVKQKSIAAAFEKDMKQMAAKSLQQDMLQEQKKMAGARAQAVRGEVDKYKALILQTISQNWLVPPSVNKNLSAELMIRVAPGGIVLDVQVIKSSGDETLDHSAQSAVFKSSPLPVPKESDAFEPFRQFVLKVKPKDILNTDNWES